MILIIHQFGLDNSVDVSEDDDEDGVDNTQAVLDVPGRLLTNFLVGSSDLFADRYDQELGA